MRKTAVLAGFALLLTLSTAFAAPPALGWPAACTLGKDCWIAQYVDHDPSPASRDLACNHRTYDKHDGTDIAVKDRAALARDIPVVAAADGVVARIRNDREDHFGTKADIEAAKAARKEAGNVVSLIHADGWITEYGHMKKGSVVVKVGERVKKGQRLGSIGQTGMAEFAHLHFSLRHKNDVVDPFAGEGFSGCGGSAAPLWESGLAYQPAVFSAAGFADDAKSLEGLLRDASSPATMSSSVEKFLFWATLWGAEPGDMLTETILDPAGKVYVQYQDRQPATQIRVLRMAGRPTARFPLHPGVYTGRATWMRQLPDGKKLEQSIEAAITVTP